MAFYVPSAIRKRPLLTAAATIILGAAGVIFTVQAPQTGLAPTGVHIVEYKDGSGSLVGYVTDQGSIKLSGSYLDATGAAVGGLSQANADARYVNRSGDTMTGSLTVQGEPRIAKSVVIPLCDAATACDTGSGVSFVMRGQGLKGNYTLSGAYLDTAYAGTTGTMTVQLRNITDSTDVFSTTIQLDTGEVSSTTAATPYVIGNATFTAGDVFVPIITAVHTTPTQGTSLILDLIPQ